MSFRLVGIASDEVGEAVEALAEKERRSVSQMVVLLVERGLEVHPDVAGKNGKQGDK